MTNAELISKIKAEIDKLYGEYKDKFHQCGDQYHLGLIDGLDMAERVLDSLESEKPIDIDFEQELYKHFGQVKDFTLGMRIGKYFYELGKQSGSSEKPMNLEEAMKELDEKIALVKQKGTWDGVDVDKYMDEVRGREPENPVPSDLEEAAEKQIDEALFKWSYDDEDGIEQYVEDAFIAGAKWQAEQLLKSSPIPEDTVLFNKGVEEGKRLMMKKAVEKTVGQLERQWGGNIHFMHGFEVDEMDFPFLNSQECGYGDKVRVIVCKKED